MANAEPAIFTNMCMVSDQNGNILVQDRRNPDWPGITFPGGHVEPGESFAASVIREVFEETGLTIENPVLCGVKQFQTRRDERYVVFLYRADRFRGELRSSDEGEVFWIDRSELQYRTLVTDFMEMLKVFDSPELNEFYYYKEDDGWGLKLL